VLSPPFFEPQLPFTQAHGNPSIPPHWEPEIKHNTLSSAAPNTSILTMEGGLCVAVAGNDEAEFTLPEGRGKFGGG